MVEGGAQLSEFLRPPGPVGGRSARDLLQAELELGEHIGLARLVGVQLETERFEPLLPQTAVDDVEGGPFFRHEEHAFAVGEAVGDDVGDGLRLSGAGRPLEHKVMAGGGGHDRGELGRVGAARAEDVAWMVVVIQLRGSDVLRRIGVGHARLMHEVADNAVPGQILQAVGEVLPEQKFGEGKLS